jgi:hypothetical protein
MQRKILRTIALASFALVVGLGAAGQVQAQDVKAPYPNMAPLDQYLMERNAEIALAWSAAPESISRDAEVRVLGRHGYETAVKGKNGFVCLVERSWMSPFDFPEFWNPKMRGPICFNPPAVRSILPLTFKRTELVLAGLSKSQIIDGIKAFDVKELPALEPGAMCYMTSKQGYLNDSARHWVPHLMGRHTNEDLVATISRLPRANLVLASSPYPKPSSFQFQAHPIKRRTAYRRGDQR